MTNLTRSEIRASCARIDAAAYIKRAKQLGYMRDYAAETRAWCKANGICQRCRKEKAEPGRTLCWSCSLANNQSRSGARQAPRVPGWYFQRAMGKEKTQRIAFVSATLSGLHCKCGCSSHPLAHWVEFEWAGPIPTPLEPEES